MTLVSTEWLNNNLSKVKIFDASWHLPNSNRDAKKEYLEKHIPNSVFWDLDEHSDKNSSYPHMMPDSNYWAKMLQRFGISNHDHIIVYDHSDLYSACRLWFTLKYFGHEKISILNGGFQKWLKEKKPVTQRIDKIEKTGIYKTSENNDWIKNKEQIDENIKNNSFILVDARSRERFEGKAAEPRPGLKKGCIPGSKNIPFQNCIDIESNTFKTKSELINIFKENNVDYYKPTVFMCGSGVTACVLGLAYFLINDKNALIYDGSFAEWGKK
jgi:thiosulfate/3-mercaptopyruvate sulfurtransferase